MSKPKELNVPTREMSEEFKEFLEENCTPVKLDEDLANKFGPGTDLYYFKGFVLARVLLKGYCEGKKLRIDKDDIIICSFPKTGTTWVEEISYLVFNDGDQTKMNTIDLDDRIPFIELMGKAEQFNEMPSPKLVKTHLPYELIPGDVSQNKIIYVCRNPKDTLVSLFNFFKMNKMINYQGTFSQLVDMFVKDLTSFSPYDLHILQLWELSKTDKRILFLTYEELKKDLKAGVRKMAEFMGKTFTEEEVAKIADRCSFQSMSSHPTSNFSNWDGVIFDYKVSKFMRKGIVGDWKNNFNEEDNKKVEDWVQKKFGKSDFKFVYELEEN